MRIAILGLGNFGSAISACWLRAGHDVMGWTIEADVHRSIERDGVNQKYLDNVSLRGMAVSMEMADVVPSADVVVLAVPSGVLGGVLDELRPHLEVSQIVLNVSKGLGTEDRLMSELIADKLPNPNALLVGPTIAPELAEGVFSTAIVASGNVGVAEKLAAELSTETFRLAVGDDPRGVELWSVFKNVVALTCGLSDGYVAGGDNLKAALFLAGCREAAVLLPRLGARPETFLTAAGLGDVFVTATSSHGRNRRLGELLGSGLTLAEAESSSVMVAEGVRASRLLKKLAGAASCESRYLDDVNALLDATITATECIERLTGSSNNAHR